MWAWNEFANGCITGAIVSTLCWYVYTMHKFNKLSADMHRWLLTELKKMGIEVRQ